MDRSELLIGKVLQWGLWLAVLVVGLGGTFYLIQCGQDIIQYKELDLMLDLNFKESLIFYTERCSAQIIILIGLFILLLTQVLRVILTAWLFFKKKDYPFVWISLSVLIILIYSIFRHD